MQVNEADLHSPFETVTSVNYRQLWTLNCLSEKKKVCVDDAFFSDVVILVDAMARKDHTKAAPMITRQHPPDPLLSARR